MTMKRSVTNIVQWCIAALSGALLVAAAHAEAPHAATAEEITSQPFDGTLRKIRVGVAALEVQKNAQAAPGGVDFREPLRGLLASQLTGAVEVMPLAALAPGDVEAEAVAKECDFILYTSITRQPTTSGKLSFWRGAAELSQYIPLVGPAHSTPGASASLTAGAVLSGAGEAARGVKARDQVSLEFRLVAVENAVPVLADLLQARATEGGQDVITPLIQQEAASVVKAIRHRTAARIFVL